MNQNTHERFTLKISFDFTTSALCPTVEATRYVSEFKSLLAWVITWVVFNLTDGIAWKVLRCLRKTAPAKFKRQLSVLTQRSVWLCFIYQPETGPHAKFPCWVWTALGMPIARKQDVPKNGPLSGSPQRQ